MAHKKELLEILKNAVEQGETDVARSTIQKGVDVNEIPWGTESLLMRAIRCRHADMAQLLIDSGVNLQYEYLKSTSPKTVETAADYCKHYDMPGILMRIQTKLATS
ncbi:uncharacterized protein LOC100376119 [Saccoglossus kowalevskii]|uniref:Uncharacterized protein LOC100376119 n=1 Tax=Saccoglossus kowalevskii TaxID=10224 RepID=A0ABM0GS18_SACKO|nr:PREDICTED: uncharacterized protein LOC100376119 [Saccoglossus kowalevskii]